MGSEEGGSATVVPVGRILAGMAEQALVFNPGSNSLKFEWIVLDEQVRIAADAHSLVQGTIDGIGKQPTLTAAVHGEPQPQQPCEAADMQAAVRAAFAWLRSQKDVPQKPAFAGVRVVHGGALFHHAMPCDDAVRKGIASLEELAPLHNSSSLAVLQALDAELPGTPAYAAFDTAFHTTLPEKAWRYPIHCETADRHGIRKFGFHGLSHRYMLERFSRLAGKPKEELSLVTLHLESGSSACAIANGCSADTTMGLTPLEGLMMGTRSGSIDPSVVPLLARKEGKSADEVLTLLNKQSGLLGIAGGSLDTRELCKRDDDAAKLALAMFSYRVRAAVGAYLAVLGRVDAVIFGGGIGENSPWLRADVAHGLTLYGLDFDVEKNERTTEGEACLSRAGSRFAAWSMPVDEAKQIALECAAAHHAH